MPDHLEDTLKKIILNFQDLPFKTGVSRQFPLETLAGKATIIMGIRRSGKSTYLKEIIQNLLDQDVSRQNIISINFFDDRLHSLQLANLNLITQAYYGLFPEKKNTEKIYYFFDEIQTVVGWESFIDRLLNTEDCEVYITGSSAQLLSKEIATQMRGRALSWEMFPFSFAEFLDYQKVTGYKAIAFSSKQSLLIQKTFLDYWEKGAFPEVAGLPPTLRIKVHQEYFQSILFRDLIERHDIGHPKALIDLAHWLIDNTASLYSINRLTGYLKSLGHKVPQATVSSYLDWLEDAYFLFSVRLFDASLSRSHSNLKKIYCIDHAFVNSVSSGILINSGHLLENLVFVTLRRTYPEIFYYRTQNRREVDFIVSPAKAPKKLFQVCESLIQPKTKKREIKALLEAMIELNLTEGTIVTQREEEVIMVDNKKIQVTPIWKFIL
jgi:predicted AAA+ superfamily ATPase